MQLKRLSLTLAALGLTSAHALAYDYAHPTALSAPELSAGAPVLMEAVTSAGSDKVPAASEKAPVVAAATTAPAKVPTEAPLPAFSAADIESLFVPSDAPMQLAALSAQEMRETEGAVLPMIILGGLMGANASAWGQHGSSLWRTGTWASTRNTAWAAATGFAGATHGSALVRAAALTGWQARFMNIHGAVVGGALGQTPPWR